VKINTPYADTLSQALDAICNEMVEMKAIPVDHWFNVDHIAYGDHKELNTELSSYRGKPTRKWAHAVIYRLESGRYEWLVYVL